MTNEQSINNVPVSINDKNTTQTNKFSTNKPVINDTAKKQDDSMSQGKLKEERSVDTNTRFNQSHSEDIKIIKNFLKIL